MANLKLDPVTHDLIPGRNYARVEDAELIVQNVKSRLLTFYKEWSLGPHLGVPWLEVLDKTYDLTALQPIISNIILTTTGVKTLTSMSVRKVPQSRHLEVQFTGTTVFGIFNSGVTL